MSKTSNAISRPAEGKKPSWRKSGDVPYPREELRQRLLTAAGFDEAARIRLIRKSLDELHQALDATKRTVVTHQGQVTATLEQPDWDARLEAIEKSWSLCDAVRGKTEGGQTAPTKLIIHLPDWATPSPTMTDITPIKGDG
jgi:hypothetical protein